MSRRSRSRARPTSPSQTVELRSSTATNAIRTDIAGGTGDCTTIPAPATMDQVVVTVNAPITGGEVDGIQLSGHQLQRRPAGRCRVRAPGRRLRRAAAERRWFGRRRWLGPLSGPASLRRRPVSDDLVANAYITNLRANFGTPRAPSGRAQPCGGDFTLEETDFDAGTPDQGSNTPTVVDPQGSTSTASASVSMKPSPTDAEGDVGQRPDGHEHHGQRHRRPGHGERRWRHSAVRHDPGGAAVEDHVDRLRHSRRHPRRGVRPANRCRLPVRPEFDRQVDRPDGRRGQRPGHRGLHGVPAHPARRRERRALRRHQPERHGPGDLRPWYPCFGARTTWCSPSSPATTTSRMR